MSGALVELVSKGVQDAYITGDPHVSFFRQNYKRHTNFAIKPVKLNYIGEFTANGDVTIQVPSGGDLLSYIWIEAPGIRASRNNTTGIYSNNDQTLFEFTLLIGGQQVMTFDSLYLQGIHEPLYKSNHARASCAVTTNTVKANAAGYSGSNSDYVMLPFFFGEDWTKALPLVALQYHQVEIRIRCRNGFQAPATAPKVWANFVYLDTDERQFFAKQEHEILFQQVQQVLASNTDTEFDLTYFNHPVKAVHLVSGKATGNQWYNEFNFAESSMYINGTTLFDSTSNTYHHNVVHEMHCDSLPDNVLDEMPVFTWAFCLNMSKDQPTGTLNFSRIDTAKLTITNPTGGNALHRVYGVNYNILRITSGMAGVAFSN
jgi:hypothetical protein